MQRIVDLGFGVLVCCFLGGVCLRARFGFWFFGGFLWDNVELGLNRGTGNCRERMINFECTSLHGVKVR